MIVCHKFLFLQVGTVDGMTLLKLATVLLNFLLVPRGLASYRTKVVELVYRCMGTLMYLCYYVQIWHW